MESPVKSPGRPAVGMGVHSAAVPTLAAIDVDTRAWASPRHVACIALVAASAHDRDEYAPSGQKRGSKQGESMILEPENP